MGRAVNNPVAKFRVKSVGVRHCNPAANPAVPRREPNMEQGRNFNVYAVTNGLEMEAGHGCRIGMEKFPKFGGICISLSFQNFPKY